MSRTEGMCARLKLPVSSRHNGPAFIAVSTNSMAEKAVPISTAAVSVPGLCIRFNDTSMRFTDGTVARQIADSLSLLFSLLVPVLQPNRGSLLIHSSGIASWRLVTNGLPLTKRKANRPRVTSWEWDNDLGNLKRPWMY
jgi:hypothetical protein